MNNNSHKQLLALYIVSPADWKRHQLGAPKVDFMMRALKSLSSDLWRTHKIPLMIQHSAKPRSEAAMLKSFVQKHAIEAVYFNNEYEVDETRRDMQVRVEMGELKVECHAYDDQCVVQPGRLKSKSSDTVYCVYSPFKKSWFDLVKNEKKTLLNAYAVPDYTQDTQVKPDIVPETVEGFTLPVNSKIPDMWPATEEFAQERLKEFVTSSKIKDYKKNRDFPDLTGTSSLSPYLSSGIISAKQCVVTAMQNNNGHLDSGSEGAVIWIQEIIWRDFYRHILVAYPRVCMNKPFKLDTLNVAWLHDDVKFEAFCQGKTGFPIVDAGIRQLLECGWMHNRVRMIVASFLTKHLLHTWRDGEKFFLKHLVDADFASNNGGWQWAASTGTDSQPYFRVFNPHLQSKRFDADGKYIKKFIPELRGVMKKNALHDPLAVLGEKEIKRLGYVVPIVKHEEARKRAIEAFQNARPVAADGDQKLAAKMTVRKNEDSDDDDSDLAPVKKRAKKTEKS